MCVRPADTSDMPRVPLIDRLLLWLFGVARNLFLLQGLAFGCAAAATFAWTRTDMAPWLARGLVFGALLSGTFVAAALLLWRMRSWTPQRDSWSDPSGSMWPGALVGSLVLIAALTLVASAGLPALWREITSQLSAIGFWDALTRSSQFGGIVILPILVALFVPALVTAAAVFSLGSSIALLARFPFRPRMFPTMTSMAAVVQIALTGTAWLATALLRELSSVAATSMSSAPDQEVRQLADQLMAAVSTLMTSATRLVVPTAVLLTWAVFLRPSGRAAGQFGREVAPGSEELPNLADSPKEEPFVAFSAEASESPVSSRMLQAGLSGRVLVGMGVLMLLFVGMDRLRSRPAYVASTPEAGAQLAGTPPAIRVTFNRPLHSASTLSLVYLPVEPSLDDISRDVPAKSQLAATDADQRTLEVIPPSLGRGLYLVRWTAYPEFGGVIRHGAFTFGVGVPVPPDRRDMRYSLNERESDDRGRRYTMLGGVMLLAFGTLVRYRGSFIQ
jgi:methionine-rich copper-binding protein CopC